MLTEEELKIRIKQAADKRRWYQKMPYLPNGFVTHFDDGKTHSYSHNDGRWDNYLCMSFNRILEGLDPKNSSFCEVGCSAGLFLLRAWREFRFGRLLGVEAGNGAFDQLQITKDYYDQMPLRIYKNALGPLETNIADSEAEPLDIKTFPIVDVTLMSCVHYHMQQHFLEKYIQQLSEKSMYLLVLTDENAGGVINPTSSFFKIAVMERSKDRWTLIDTVRTPQEWKSLTPRCKNLTVLIYKSNILKRLFTRDCFRKQLQHSSANEVFYKDIFPAFINDVLEGKITAANYDQSSVYAWSLSSHYGSTPWSPEISKERTLSYINMVLTMKDHGQEQPIALQEHLDMVDPWDGYHRVAVLDHLGCKYVYGKDVIPDVWTQHKIGILGRNKRLQRGSVSSQGGGIS